MRSACGGNSHESANSPKSQFLQDARKRNRNTAVPWHTTDVRPSCSCAQALCVECRQTFALMDAALTAFVDFVASLDGVRLSISQLQAMDRALQTARRIGGDDGG
jgi:hypothetical protein